MAGTESPRIKLEGLQVLRGVAAILVLWAHLKNELGRDVTHFLTVPFLATNLGQIGVDIFFVISGFVISMSAAKMGDDWRAFLASRLARIVPLYFTLSTFFLLEAVASGHPGGRISGLSVFDTYAFIPLFDSRNSPGPILVSGWTLSFEIWFYLCFAGLMNFRSARHAWLLLPGFFAIGMAVNMAFNQSGPWFLPKFLFHPMTLEFCAGCILYHAQNRIGKSALFIMGGLSLLFLYLAYYYNSSLGGAWTSLNDLKAGLLRAIVWGGFATCLVGLVSQIDLKYRWKWPRFMLLLGDASYSIYLVPSAFMMVFEIGIHHLSKLSGHDLTPPPVWYGSVYVLGTVAAGIACWKFFESPASKLAKGFLFRFVPDKRDKPNAHVASPVNETRTAGRLTTRIPSNSTHFSSSDASGL